DAAAGRLRAARPVRPRRGSTRPGPGGHGDGGLRARDRRRGDHQPSGRPVMSSFAIGRTGPLCAAVAMAIWAALSGGSVAAAQLPSAGLGTGITFESYEFSSAEAVGME